MRKTTFFKTLTLTLFFCIGLLISFFYQKQKRKAENVEEVEKAEKIENAEQESETAVWQEQELESSDFTTGQTANSSQGKFSIIESKKISADKTNVETGEDVRFWLTIKNNGVKVKTLTHLCFNHSGDANFGCLLDHTLAPGQEFSISNTTRFYSPGVYSVWFTWSQDKTNFYKASNGSSVQIVVE